MPCLTGLFNLVSNISHGTDLEEYVARRNEYVDLFGGDLRGRFGACQRGDVGLIFSSDFRDRLMQEALRRERERTEPPESLRKRAVTEAAEVARFASAAVAEIVAEFGFPAGSRSRHPGPSA